MTSNKLESCNLQRRGQSKAGLLAILAVVIIAGYLASDYWSSVPDDVAVTYVGRAACIDCHGEQLDAWAGSPHDKAMEAASDETVLASFDDIELEHHGVKSRAYRAGDKFMFTAEDGEGHLRDYEVKFTFGYDPLQQFMVETERSDQPNCLGKVQVLRWSWDIAKQEWFYLEPPDVSDRLSPDDPLHWTGYAQNWNHMCADCHSTDLHKAFDLAERRYHTRFSEMNVSCEACHGPGSLHVELASANSIFWDRKRGYGLPAKLQVLDNKPQIDACAPCHARRRRTSDHYQPGDPFFDHYSVQLMTPDTYYPDGQIRDEVYVYGSFLQSKMYANGIKCTDCHNPHTTQVKFEDNRLCTSCHQHSAAKYDTPAHHHHDVGSAGASCIECHMPETPYMAIDLRRDHRLGVPRPDLSVEFATPNACTACHLDDSPLRRERDASLPYYADWLEAGRTGDTEVADELARLNEWAAAAVRQWYGETDRDRAPTEAFHMAWTGDQAAAKKVQQLAADRKRSAFVRASAVALLPQYRSDQSEKVARRALGDRDPMVRGAACGYFADGDITDRLALLTPLLNDSTRHVRLEAANALASVPPHALMSPARRAMEDNLAEHRSALLVDGDQAGSHISLAMLAERQQDVTAAMEHYVDAIRVQPSVAGPRSNLAALLDSAGKPDEAKRLRQQELPLLARDARLAPQSAGLQYRLGLAMYLAGRLDEVEAPIARAVELEPENTSYALFLALFYERQNQLPQAIEVAQKLVALQPNNPMFAQTLAKFLRQQQAAEQPSNDRADE